jgi:hypothetical protein
MSTPVSPRSSGSSSPTRQQLDELDALLQRMLALPVAPGDEADQAVEPPPPAAETSAPVNGSLPAAEEFTVRTLALIRLDPPGTETPPHPDPAAPEDGADAAVTEPVPEPAAAGEPVPELPGRERRPLPGWLRPVVWANRAFDQVAGCLGAPGRWLRRPWGRTLLGLAGLLLLAAAVGWIVLDRMGWPGWPALLRWW